MINKINDDIILIGDKMNKWSLENLKDLLNIKEIINCQEDIVFDYLRIVDLNGVKYEKEAKNTLFFLTYSEDEDVNNGFIINAFDLRKNANDIIKNNPNYVFVIDYETYNSLEENNKKTKLIIVENILESINLLYNYIIKNKKAQVIAITGSVGKTTSVGLITEVMKQKYKVIRVYSKRITPIILKANLINFLIEDVDYIILEMSIYHKNHVEILSDLLHPDIAAIINIDSSHLEFFNSIEDICIHKSSIFRHATFGFYNNLDNIANNLSLKNNDLYFKNEKIYKTNLKKLVKIVDEYKMEKEFLIINNKRIKLHFASTLSIVQTLLAYKIGKLTKIEDDKIIEALNSYVPVENRIQLKKAFNKEIVFDGDITTNERIKQLADNKYPKCYLVIRKFGSMENNKRFELVLNFLDKFTNVYVFDDIEYLNMLKKHPKVIIVNNHNFMKDLDGKIIYHYSGYYRSFNEFNEKNLINLENTIYKIMKPEK